MHGLSSRFGSENISFPTLVLICSLNEATTSGSPGSSIYHQPGRPVRESVRNNAATGGIFKRLGWPGWA